MKLNRYRPVDFTHVSIRDKFWQGRIEQNQVRTIPFQYEQCRITGRIDAFKQDWQPGQEPVPHIFWDSDVAKWVEGASYSLAMHPDPELAQLLQEVVSLIASAQEPDGYLNTHFTPVEPDKRWTNLRDDHELYCAGHLIEAAIAHHEVTGEKIFLDVMRHYTDYIDSVFGREPGKKRGYCGHPEIELALVRLYRTTGETRYLELSRYFVDERGQQPHYYDMEAIERGEAPEGFSHGTYEYNQSHKPISEQTEVVGHAVRAMYLYCAMTDLAYELGDVERYAVCERLWEHLVSKRMYITGGIGSSRHNEGFTADYDLPNETAYAETCAAIGLVFWAWRMLQRQPARRYADVMERALYNGVISGISLDGKSFFYDNPLASSGQHQRKEWFGCACCPPNLARLLASFGQYLYSISEDELAIAVHLFVQSETELILHGNKIVLQQQTDYPWDGKVTFTVIPEQPLEFALKIRIPYWCNHATLNGETVLFETLENGYLNVKHVWKPYETLELILDMPVQRVYTHPSVIENRGCVALQRGPLVYCLESSDNISPLSLLSLSPDVPLHPVYEPDLLDGIVVIKGEAQIENLAAWHHRLYTSHLSKPLSALFVAVPYYAWNNRGTGEMRVWVRSNGSG